MLGPQSPRIPNGSRFRGECGSANCSSTSTESFASRNSQARNRPTGPAPAMITSYTKVSSWLGFGLRMRQRINSGSGDPRMHLQAVDVPSPPAESEARAHLAGLALAAARRLDGGDVDLPHRHHRFECALGLSAAGGKRVGEHAWGDLPVEAPAVLTPTARAFGAAIVDDGIPESVSLFLIVGRDLEREGFAVFELRPAVETETGNA